MYRIRDWLYIGNYQEMADETLLRSRNIRAVLQLILSVKIPDGIDNLCIPIIDGDPLAPDKLAQGVGFVRTHKAQGHNLLIACAAGVSRSVSFAMAALIEEESLRLVQAYHEIRRWHPNADPHPALLRSLRTYYQDPISLEDLWHEMRESSRLG